MFIFRTINLLRKIIYFKVLRPSVVEMCCKIYYRSFSFFSEDVKCFGDKTCYSLAFGVPAVLMIVALSESSHFKFKLLCLMVLFVKILIFLI